MPSWPSGVSLCTVTFGPALDGAGDKASLVGELTLDDPSRKVIWSATNTAILSAKGVAGANTADTRLEFTVPHVDQAGFVDGNGDPITMWGYTLRVIARWGERQGRRWVERDKVVIRRYFQPLVGTVTLDLTAGGEGEFVPPVGGGSIDITSVAGVGGPVVAAAELATALSSSLVGRLEPATFTYNADGTIATETVGGVTTSYTYDAEGDLDTATRSGTTYQYVYDTEGNLTDVEEVA